MKKIMAVLGTRPEAIKMCPVIIELKKRKNVDLYVCITGQHREMLRSVLDIFGVRADCDLDIMKEGQSLADITKAVLDGISEVLEREKPDVVLVHGDTTTAFAASSISFAPSSSLANCSNASATMVFNTMLGSATFA